MTRHSPAKGHRGRLAHASGAVLLLALVTGCTTDTPAAPTPTVAGVSDAERQFTALLTRPDADTARTQHHQLRQRIQQLLSTVLPLPPWHYDDPQDSERGCGTPFTAVDAWDATREYLGRSSVPRVLTPAEWVIAKTTVSDTAAHAGFTHTALVIDQPGNYEVELQDGSGGRVSLGSDVTTVLAIETGCYLTATAHDRGPPAHHRGAGPAGSTMIRALTVLDRQKSCEDAELSRVFRDRHTDSGARCVRIVRREAGT